MTDTVTGIASLNALIERTTVAYRKNAEVTETDVGGVRVVEVFGYPETPPRGALVDVHFVNVGFAEAVAGLDRDALIAALKDAEDGYNGVTIPFALHCGGPSYITLGAWLGSQEYALRLLALGQHVGLWKVVTPATLGLDGADADDLAGRGMVMHQGFRP